MKQQNAVNGFKGTGLYPLSTKAIQHRTLLTEKRNNQELTNKDTPTTTNTTSEIRPLDSPLKDLKKATLATLSPTPSSNIILAIQNSKEKSKRVQSDCDEVIHKTDLERLDD